MGRIWISRSSAALLQSMPGIVLITAMTIFAEFGNLNRFRSRAAVGGAWHGPRLRGHASCRAGLVSICRSSNDKRYCGGITHRGSKHLRAMLAEAAWMAVPRVPVYRHLFERIAQKKNKLVAVTAVARRMLEDAITMLTRVEAFRYVPAPTASAEQTRDSHVGQPCASRTVIEGPKVASSVAG